MEPDQTTHSPRLSTDKHWHTSWKQRDRCYRLTTFAITYPSHAGGDKITPTGNLRPQRTSTRTITAHDHYHTANSCNVRTPTLPEATLTIRKASITVWTDVFWWERQTTTKLPLVGWPPWPQQNCPLWDERHDHNKTAPCGMIKVFWIELRWLLNASFLLLLSKLELDTKDDTVQLPCFQSRGGNMHQKQNEFFRSIYYY